MRRRTTLALDHELVGSAANVLGTTKIVDTVHAALQDVIARERRAALVRMPMPDLTPEALAGMRGPRTFEARERATSD
ncbi:MAG: hypothetical protein M3406_04370 [Chloroflexota bacterium]|nr:hypothetical protein [Chloroflexota bacterium]